MPLQRESLKTAKANISNAEKNLNQKSNSKHLHLLTQQNQKSELSIKYSLFLCYHVKMKTYDKGTLDNANTLLYKALI